MKNIYKIVLSVFVFMFVFSAVKVSEVKAKVTEEHMCVYSGTTGQSVHYYLTETGWQWDYSVSGQQGSCAAV